MKLEARENNVRLTLESNHGPAHSVLTDHGPEVAAVLRRVAAWFDAEIDRLEAPPKTAPVLDVRGRVVGQRIVESSASDYFGRKFGDGLDAFKPEK